MKKIIFWLLTVVTIFSFIYCCDAPIICDAGILQNLIVNKDSIWYSIGCSIIAAYIFYLIQIVLPDVLGWYKSIDYRYPVYCDVFNYTDMIINIFEKILGAAGEQRSFYLDDIEFKKKIMDCMKAVPMNQSYCDRKISKLLKDNAKRSGEIYKECRGNVPAEVESWMFYISERSHCISDLEGIIDRMSINDPPSSLYQCFPRNGDKSGQDSVFGLDETFERIECLVKWLRVERKKLIHIRNMQNKMKVVHTVTAGLSIWDIDVWRKIKVRE